MFIFIYSNLIQMPYERKKPIQIRVDVIPVTF